MLMIWLLWNNRNRSLHNLRCSTPAEISRNVGRLMADINSAQNRSDITESAAATRWEPPIAGTMSEWGGLVLDIIDIAGEYSSVRFNHIRRSANGCAHNMAKLSIVLGDYKGWRNMVPTVLCNPDVIPV
ncbi:hypothetical protein CRYUN_Cryun41cG0040600 [Craigia yunnanensis]